MGIEIANAVTIPQVTYNKIHMTKLEVIQPIFVDNTSIPNYQVIIHYRHYGVVEGVRYYMNEEVQRISIGEFVEKATQKAQLGDMTLMNALTSIEAAVAGIIEDQTNNSAQVVNG